MKKSLSKLLALLLVLCVGMCLFTACGGENNYEGYVYFGMYPQTIKENNVTVSDTPDAEGYYVGSDGELYVKIVATPYNGEYRTVDKWVDNKPIYRKYKFSNNWTVEKGETYYFKVEPIRWRVLSNENGQALLICDSIIANMKFNDLPQSLDSNISYNKYSVSKIRQWLNNEFFETAFSEEEQVKINTVAVDDVQNNIEDVVYDKVFLLSKSQVEYYDGIKVSLTSDYSRATGAWMSDSRTYWGYGFSWLRSVPRIESGAKEGEYKYNDCVLNLSIAGNCVNTPRVDREDGGVLPVIQIVVD